MKMLKNKTFAIAITILLTLSMSAAMILIPNANAHTPAWDIQLYAYINVAPNPVGVGQSVTVGFWLNAPPMTAGGPYGDRYGPFTVHVTKPDGTTETLGPFTSDDTGGTSTQYTPTQTGTYTFQMTYPGQTLNGGPNGLKGISNPTYINDTILPANSNVETLTVQQQPVGGVSMAPLPTNYWQTPINALNVHNWYAIGGPSLSLGGGAGRYNTSANYNPFTTAPTSAHILWTKPEAFGGVIGGDAGGTTTYGNYYSTAQYEKKYNPIIINGFVYYTVYPGSSTTPTANICVNLYTGQTVWTDDASNYGGGSPQQTALTSSGIVTPLLCGQVLDYVSPNQYGGLAYLWTSGTPDGIVSRGTTMNMFDAETGTYILSIVNGTRMTMMSDAGGNLIGYYVNNTAGKQVIMGTLNDNTGPSPTVVTSTGPTLDMWNSTECIMAGAWGSSASGWEWRPPQGGVISFNNGLVWSEPIATDYSGNKLPVPLSIAAAGPITTGQDIGSDVVVMSTHESLTLGFQTGWQVEAGYSATTGQQLWIENRTFPEFSRVVGEGDGDGVYSEIAYATSTIYGFSVNTGKLLWQDTLTGFNGAAPDPYDSIGGYMSTLANGTLFLAGFGGDIWSINMQTGKVNWYTNTTALQGSAGTDSPYGVWPVWPFSMGGVANGVLFLEEGHEYSPPLFLGARQLAINCTNGELVWSIDAFDVNSMPVTAYGVMTIINAYDNQIYAYGKGPSATTVSAPQSGVTTSAPLTITGTVMDVSAGSLQQAVAANYPHGLPAVSDASMSQFMESVYMQQPMPSNTTGVPVTVSVTDSNGNCYDIGTTTTNANGFYSLSWTPTIPGNFTVTATFAGTQSYYGSTANAAFYASAASTSSTPAPATNYATTSDLMMYTAAAAVAIIIAIAIATVLLLRKKP